MQFDIMQYCRPENPKFDIMPWTGMIANFVFSSQNRNVYDIPEGDLCGVNYDILDYVRGNSQQPKVSHNMAPDLDIHWVLHVFPNFTTVLDI